MPGVRRATPEATGLGYVLLGEIAERFTAAGLAMLEVSCNRCDRRGRLSIARLLAEHGPRCQVPSCAASSRTTARA